jgi:SAM-dependent methyltransferase
MLGPMKATWPAPERNKGPILEVLQRLLPQRGALLEIASGSGQHAVHFARHLPGWTWQATDCDPANLASIEAHRLEADCARLLPARELDVRAADWDVGSFDAVFNANMIHITPWACCVGLIRGVEKHLRPEGLFILYGPFRIAGQHTAPSNASFDAGLKQQDPTWGVRDVEAVSALAQASDLAFTELIPMPANNHCLVFTRATEA